MDIMHRKFVSAEVIVANACNKWGIGTVANKILKSGCRACSAPELFELGSGKAKESGPPRDSDLSVPLC